MPRIMSYRLFMSITYKDSLLLKSRNFRGSRTRVSATSIKPPSARRACTRSRVLCLSQAKYALCSRISAERLTKFAVAPESINTVNGWRNPFTAAWKTRSPFPLDSGVELAVAKLPTRYVVGETIDVAPSVCFSTDGARRFPATGTELGFHVHGRRHFAGHLGPVRHLLEVDDNHGSSDPCGCS